MAVAFWKILITFPEPKQLSEVHLEATLRYVDPGAKTPFRGEQGSSVMPPNQEAPLHLPPPSPRSASRPAMTCLVASLHQASARAPPRRRAGTARAASNSSALAPRRRPSLRSAGAPHGRSTRCGPWLPTTARQAAGALARRIAELPGCLHFPVPARRE